uniref:Uncharacterized protein n=1 Tax=Rhizophora mucronata TaxID=61149 RepID=A0A2P2QR64_RHIMU
MLPRSPGLCCGW